MSLSNISREQISGAYRSLYRASLQAVQYAQPARTIIVAKLRYEFRTRPVEDFQPPRIEKTIQFLQNAKQQKGIEHRILKRLLHTWFFEQTYKEYVPIWSTTQKARRRNYGSTTRLAKMALDHFHSTLTLFDGINKTLIR
ncbi:MAG: hypothetical protein M1834_009116 [Cirrosporium novae-zelandiae]|nr:MAG: hypothetical protein M1834_009116 [Cirrosporium novae-zelandiae]